MLTPNLNVLLHGDYAALPEQKNLHAGPLTLIFEAGDLRYIALGRRELVRRIYGAVRDRHWGTVYGRLTDVVLSSDADQFRVSYTAEHRAGDVDLVWRADIGGRRTARSRSNLPARRGRRSRAVADPLVFRTARRAGAGALTIELPPFATARVDGEVRGGR